MSAARQRFQGVLFDLDGTLVDSAPDLAGAADDMRVLRGQVTLGLATYRPHCGSGARGMLRCAFKSLPGSDGFEALRTEFLDRYEQRMLQQTGLFTAAASMLDAFDAAAMPWGIVTNKALRFALPLTDALGLSQRARVLVAGDSTAHTKPHPAPLLEAARRAGWEPRRCAYVGDDERDMQAARAAGMVPLAAGWGYVDGASEIGNWGAEAVLADPQALLKWLDMA